MRKKVGIFGGTFDPIHIGHLRMALELKQQLGLDEMRLVPCHQPSHRGRPQASSTARAEMLRIGLMDCPALQMDTRELERDKPSYTYDTLCELRAELGADTSLVLCMGQDAFAGLASWHRWQKLVALAHLVVIERPGWQLPASGEVIELLNHRQGELANLEASAAGSIVLYRLRLLPISATEIRQQIGRGESAQFLVPEGVWTYICEQDLYRP